MQNFPDSFIMTVYVPGGGMKISSPGNLCRIGNCEMGNDNKDVLPLL